MYIHIVFSVLCDCYFYSAVAVVKIQLHMQVLDISVACSVIAFSALKLLVGCQEEHWPIKIE